MRHRTVSAGTCQCPRHRYSARRHAVLKLHLQFEEARRQQDDREDHPQRGQAHDLQRHWTTEMLSEGTGQERAERHQTTIQEEDAHDTAAYVARGQELQQRLVLGLVGHHTDTNAEGTDGGRHDLTRRGKAQQRHSKGERPYHDRPSIAVAPLYRSDPQRAEYRTDADDGCQQALHAGPAVQDVFGEDGQQTHVRHTQGERTVRQDHQGANVAVLDHKSQTCCHTVPEGLTTCRCCLRTAHWHHHLDSPERRQDEHDRLYVIGAVGASESNQYAGQRWPDSARHVHGHSVERQGIHQIPGTDDVTNQRLACWLLERLDGPDQKAGHIHVPRLHAVQEH